MRNDSLAVLSYKPHVDNHLKGFIAATQKEFNTFAWSKDACLRIAKFVVAGKTIRGSLVMYAHNLFGKETPDPVLDAAAAMELIHAGLLIHDDIMDCDTIRRGMPTLQSQYEQFAAIQKGNEVAHFGMSQSVNIADLCYFLGYRLLSSSGGSINQFVSKELSMVVFAQMQDVAGSHLPQSYDQNVVLDLYRYKTARYTFSLPMRLGAMLANADAHTFDSLERLGESLGLLFQIRDDELNAGGNAIITGKSAGSDSANHKQTLATIMSAGDLEKFRRQQRIDAQSVIRSLPIASDRMRELTALLRFCEERTR